MREKNIVVSRLTRRPVYELDVELVERKGLGHPDYIADAIAEEVSKALSRYYLENFEHILHHNVDKVLVVGGQADVWFGGGNVLRPIYILVAGRATTSVRVDGEEKQVPVGSIVLKAAREWLSKNFRFLDVTSHVVIDYRIGRGSADLVRLIEEKAKYPGANDTSLGVGFAPLTETERIVYGVERYLNSSEVKARIPAIGEDIKVMGLRQGNTLRLTVAVAIVSRFVHSVEEYREVKEKIKEEIERFASRTTNMEIHAEVNTGDDLSKGRAGAYIVVTGTSAEHGDDGATGRGNRAGGLITPMRPMSMEATAGKNPVNHVGKLYNVMAHIIARRIASSLDEVKEVYIKLLSQIGRPINDPLVAHVGVICDPEIFSSVKREVESIVSEELDNIDKLTERILRGSIDVPLF